MIERSQFELIKAKHGRYASWAIWAEAGEKPKSNMADMAIFDLGVNPSLLDTIRNNVVMVGLNISRSFSEPFKNFHDSNPRANDYKIRYAFRKSEYYGAYMTDIIKNFELVDSVDVLNYIKTNPPVIEKSIKLFREELSDLNTGEPIILAFGTTVHKILNENLKRQDYSKLIKLTHYSHHISKENYRTAVLGQIEKEFLKLNI